MNKNKIEFKPNGYNSLSPYLVVKNASKLIDLLTKIFGAKVTRQFNNPDGSIMHAEVLIDDSILMIGDAQDDYHARITVLHVYVTDSKTTY